jgi:L-seryl-tRNA(Ser) seleniumtransferase
MKSEVLIQKTHRNPFDHAVRNAGVKLVEFSSKDQLLNSITNRTAMLYFLGGGGHGEEEDVVSFEDCLAACKKAGVAVMMDAANLIPPWENIPKLAAVGTDLICISGGKHMRGPQCSGILAGRRNLIRAALLNSSPNEDAFGRPMKVGREEIIGVWLAAEKYAKLDFSLLDRQSLESAEYLARELRKISGLQVGFAPYEKHRRIHRVVVQWDESKLGLTADEAERQLLEGNPRIAVLRNRPQGLKFAMFLSDPGDERIAARRMKEIFPRA